MSTDAPTPQILDSTLREGEQTPGVHWTVEDKLTIARRLDAFGVDYIEAGHPAVSADVEASTRAVCREGLDAQTVVHARAMRQDIDRAIAAEADWVGIFYCVRQEALSQRFGRDLDAVTAQVQDTVQYAVDHGLRVRYTPEDTVRSPWPNVERVARAAVEAGADRISIADTTGCMTPTRIHDVVAQMRATVPVPVHVHCHNDLGMAVANSLAAVDAGALVVDTCVGGLGERTGITDLAAFATAARLAGRHETAWDLTALPSLSRIVAQRSGIPVSVQAPVVGANAFTHNAGLHTAAVFHDPAHYESIPAAAVGRTRDVCLDRFSSLATVQFKLQAMEIDASGDDARRILRHMKETETRRLTDDQFRHLVTDLLLHQVAV